ncbi:MAG: methyltransferase domain-containing protein [Chloroflexi bacterium]|nr:methyltransferase domain-containing protein [Chloroflexota bacterium]
MSQVESSGMIEAPVTTGAIRRTYDLWSWFYGSVVAPLESRARRRGLEFAAIRPGDRVLEVAVGPGATLPDILRRVGATDVVYGVDLSSRMLARARQRVARAGFANVDLRLADARSLPFSDATFDVLFNSYMFDLLPLGDMPVVLGEFRRVLKDGGRLVLVNMSKDHGITLYERLYLATPAVLVPYLFGGCRPVLMADQVQAAGFRDVHREFVAGALSSEVVVARR